MVNPNVEPLMEPYTQIKYADKKFVQLETYISFVNEHIFWQRAFWLGGGVTCRHMSECHIIIRLLLLWVLSLIMSIVSVCKQYCDGMHYERWKLHQIL